MDKIVKSIIRLFKKPIYEYFVTMDHENYYRERWVEYQKDGWEMCGDIVIIPRKGYNGGPFYKIPMKKRIN